MAGVRGRGFSTGKALQILFRIIADGTQARREVNKTAREAAGEIRSVEVLLQRALSVLSRPIRSRLGWSGALGLSFAREQLRGLAANEIQKVKKAYGEVGDEAEKASKRAAKATSGAAASITSVSAALLAIRSKPAAEQIQSLSKEYADATFAIKTFEGVLNRTLQPDTSKKSKLFGPQLASGDTLKALLGTTGVVPSRVRSDDFLGKFGISFRDKGAEEALAEFQKGFNQIGNSVTRAAVAFRFFGADTAKMLPILEKARTVETDAAKQFEEAAKKVAAMEQAQREVQEAKIFLSKKRAEALELETLAIKKAEAAEEHRIRATLFPLEQKPLPTVPTLGGGTTRADLRAQSSSTIGGKTGQRPPDWLLKQLGLDPKGFDLEQIANLQKMEAQKVADVDRAAAILKHNEELLVKSTKDFEEVHNVFLRSRGDIPRAVDDTNRVAQAITRAKDEISALEGQLEIVGSKAGDLFKTPWSPEVEVLESRIRKLKEEIELLNPALIKMNDRERDVKDTTLLLEKAVDDQRKLRDHDKDSVESARKSLEKYKKTLALDPVQKARTIDRLNVAGTETQATEAATAATAAKNIEDAAAIDLLKKETIAATATTAALTDLGAVITLTATETEILNKALKQTGGKGGTAALLDALKRFKTFQAGPSGGGAGQTVPPLDPTSLAKVESFLTKLGLMTTDAEKAAFAVESLGEKAAGEMAAGLGIATTAANTTTAATASLTATLVPLAIGFGIVSAAALVFVGVAFLIAKKVANTDAVIGRLAEKTGIAAELLSGLDSAAKKAGLSGIKSIQERVGSFQRILGQVARGELPQTAFLFKKLGIDAQTGGRDVNDSLIKVVNAFNQIQDPGQRAVLMQQAFADRTGKVGLALKAIGPDFEKYLKYLQQNGRLLSEEGAKGALEFSRQVEDIGEQFKAALLQIGRGIIRTQAFQVGLRSLTTEVYGFNSAMEDLGGIIGTTVFLLEGPFLAAAATLKTFSQGVKFGDPGFWTLWNSNMDQIIMGNGEMIKSEEEMQAEIDDTLKKEEMRAKTAVQLKEQERDARANIEQQITDQYKRQVDLRTSTREQLAQQEIKQTQSDAVERIKVVIENMKTESERTTDGTKEANDQKRANLLGFLNEIAKINNEGISKVFDIQAQEQIRMRDAEDQFHEDVLAGQRAWADERIDTLRFEADRNITTREETLEKIKTIEEAQTAAEMKELERRIGNAGKDYELLRKLGAQRTQKMAQDQQAANQRQREIAQAGYDARLADIQLFYSKLDVITVGLNARIAVIQDAAARRNVILSNLPTTLIAKDELQTAQDIVNAIEAEISELKLAFKDTGDATYRLGIALANVDEKQKIFNQSQQAEKLPVTRVQALIQAHAVEIDILNDKINAKTLEKKLLDDQGKDSRQAQQELEKLQADKKASVEKNGRDLRDAYIQQAEELRQIAARTNDILRDARETNIQLNLKFLAKQQEYVNLTVAQRIKIKEMEFQLQKESIDNESKSNLERIANEREAVLNSGLTDDEWLEAEESFHAAREAELRRHNGEIKMLTIQSQEDIKATHLAGGDFEAGLSGQDPFAASLASRNEAFIKTGKTAVSMGDMVKLGMGVAGQAVGAMAEATGSLVENWVLMGTTGPAAMKKITASILASLAKQATVEAIMELARGFAALARAFFGDPKAGAEAALHFKSAALFGVVAAVAAVSGRAVAGDTFAQQSATKSAAEAQAKEKETQHINEGRKQYVEHIHRVVVTGEKGFVARQFVDEIKNNNQEVRRAVNTATK